MSEVGLIWLVLRTDDNGGTFLVRDGLDEREARTLVDTLTARGHKQTYTAHGYASSAERRELLAGLGVRI